ncbi:MAG: histidine kinase [Natronospirillum sp.]|uniref:histidine kinase n=1 Tax=Natronospirillum sp. TaxID=2812955 RepID=UPI0025F87D1E|nr:histidine kinase [Natronospirillum sp.]MCH8550593.1 histidine kinase [Natronospirillum sp.]
MKPEAIRAEPIVLSDIQRDCYQEIANVAMGQAADLLARLLNVFVELPIPQVNLFEITDLHMALQSLDQEEAASAVCQGFAGDGITGEALIIFNDSNFDDIARLMNYTGEHSEAMHVELLMDVANILIGAFLKGLAEQLDLAFSQGHPAVLGQHKPIRDLLRPTHQSWHQTLAIEIIYALENHPVNCDLLLLFTEDSIEVMNKKIAYLLED